MSDTDNLKKKCVFLQCAIMVVLMKLQKNCSNSYFCVSSDDPYVYSLGRKCKWTLRLPRNRSSDIMALTNDSVNGLSEQICQDLKCGSVHSINKTSSPGNITCFQNCSYQHGRLENCSLSVGSSCSVIHEVVCGKTFL